MGGLEQLIQLDQELFLAWTSGGSGAAIPFFRVLSAPWLSYGVLALLLAYAARTWELMRVVQWAALLIAAVALSDWLSVHAFKEVLERLRPCHDPNLVGKFVLGAERCGGRYGFVSSHAATVWAAWMVVRAARPPRHVWIAMTTYAVLVSYSRIYLGVHYPGDVLGGAMLGVTVAAVLLAWRKSPTFSTL